MLPVLAERRPAAGPDRADVGAAGQLYNNIYQDDRRVTFTGNSGLSNSPRQRRVWDEESINTGKEPGAPRSVTLALNLKM